MKRFTFTVLLSLCCLACDASIGRTIALVGDSTALSIVEQLVFCVSDRPAGDLVVPVATVPGYQLVRDAYYFAGRLTSAYGPAAPTTPQPNAVVVLLGTNDMVLATQPAPGAPIPAPPTEATFEASAEMILAAVPTGTRVLWIESTAPVLDASIRTALHNALTRVAARHPQMELMVPPETVYAPGDVHFSPQGEIDIAVAITRALDAPQEGKL